jgi:hypothetical protein
MNLSDFRDRFVPMVTEWVDEGTAARLNKGQYKMVFDEKSDKKESVRTKQKEGMGTLLPTPPKADVKEIYLGDGWPKKISQVKYAAMVDFPIEVQLFKLMDIIADHVEGLEEAGPFLVELLAAAMINSGHLTLSSVPTVNNVPLFDPIGGDGLPLFSQSHTFKSDNRTWSNLNGAYGGAYATLSRSTVQTTAQTVRRYTGSSGKYQGIMIDHLIVPGELQAAASEVCKSQLQPETANNAYNSAREYLGEGDYKVWDWLASTTDYYAKTTARNDLAIRWAQKPKTIRGPEDKNLSERIINYMILSIGFNLGKSIFSWKVV